MPTRIWLTFKQHRFETITVTALCLGLAVAGLLEAWRLNSLNFPPSCLMDGRVPWFDQSAPATPCSVASGQFHAIATEADMYLVRLFEQIMPFIVGIALGAPIVAREIETGTAPLSWALAGSRVHWLLGKMLAVVVLAAPLLLVAGLAADVREGALVPGADPHASFEYYADRGVFMVFWGMATLLGTVALGTLFGRTMPAVTVALIVCVFVRGPWEQTWNQTVLRPFAVMADTTYQSSDLWVFQSAELYLDGKIWTGDLDLWWQQHQPIGPTADPSGSPGTGAGAQPIDMGPPPMPATYVIHGSQYWPVVALESTVLLAGAVFGGAAALFLVGRRRPY